ncbi:multiprotein-bridging factor 1 [Ascosphaera pollenicola]|nr:multiprotein-bridging factor 1 [Ascosphaera pollenicola]
MADTMEPQVDETPISPSAVSRPLESFFKRRPSASELKERHILLDTSVAPALQTAQQHLLRQQAIDNLKKQLDHRPERAELVERNILPETNAAPALIAHAHDLEKNMRRDSLEHKLQNRPQLEKLIEKGIVEKTQ